MDDIYLDSILFALRRNHNYMPERQCMEEVGRHYTEFETAQSYLFEQGYISYEGAADNNYIVFTPKGLRFIEGGSFEHLTKLNNSPLDANKIANDSNTLAKWAIGISILALIASVVAIYLQYR